MHKTIITEILFEGTTPILEFDIQRKTDGVWVGFKPDTLTMTIRDGLTDVIVNNRDAVDVLPFCDANGHVTFTFDSADLTFHDPSQPTELRRCLFAWRWAFDKRSDSHLIEFPIENHASLPQIVPATAR